MYIGDTTQGGVRQLVRDTLLCAFNSVAQGVSDQVFAEVSEDSTVLVACWGDQRGLPDFEFQPDATPERLANLINERTSSFAFEKGKQYRFPPRFPRSLFTTIFLSDRCILKTRVAGWEFKHTFQHGLPAEPPTFQPTNGPPGWSIEFHPDSTIFSNVGREIKGGRSHCLVFDALVGLHAGIASMRGKRDGMLTQPMSHCSTLRSPV